MGFFDKLFGKQGQMPRGEVVRILAGRSPNCSHQWEEQEWDTSRYGSDFEVIDGSWYAHFRHAYRCELCGGEIVTSVTALY